VKQTTKKDPKFILKNHNPQVWREEYTIDGDLRHEFVLQIDDGRSMNPQEARRVEPRVKLRHGLPQQVVLSFKPPLMITQAPAHSFVTDLKADQV